MTATIEQISHELQVHEGLLSMLREHDAAYHQQRIALLEKDEVLKHALNTSVGSPSVSAIHSTSYQRVLSARTQLRKNLTTLNNTIDQNQRLIDYLEGVVERLRKMVPTHPDATKSH